MAKRLVTSEDLLAFHTVGDVQIAPRDGALVYVERWIDKENNRAATALYIYKDGSARRLTFADSDRMPRFSPGGDRLAFLAKRSHDTQIWLLDMGGGEAVKLTSIAGGVTEFSWSPDGTKLGFIAMLDGDGITPERENDENDENDEQDLLKKYNKDVKVITELAHKLDGVGYYTERRPHVCVVDAREGATPKQLTSGPYRHSELTWHPSGDFLIFSARRGEDYDRGDLRERIWRQDVSGGEPRPLTPPSLSAGGAAVSPDGQTLAYLAIDPEEDGYDNATVTVQSLPDGEARRLAVSFDRPFMNEVATDMPPIGGGGLTFSQDGRHIYSLVSDRGTVQLAKLDVATGAPQMLTNGDHVVFSYAVCKSESQFALGIAGPLSPGDLYGMQAGQQPRRVVAANETLLSELQLSEPQRFAARAEGGPELDGWVMKPAQRHDGERYPTILEIHGGPMSMYAATMFFEFQRLAAAGYGVVYGNPRGSQGYGAGFCAAIRERWGDKDYADLMAILDTAIRENDWIDTKRLGVAGGSYGGYMTNWIVSHTDRFAAAVTMRSVVDWKAMVGTGDGGWMWLKRSGDVPPWSENDEWYRQQSPITYVENIVTPLLIEHQEGDLRCPIEQGEMLYTAVKWLGKAPTKFIRYPNEFHGMSRDGQPWHRVFRLNSIVDWFATYLSAAGQKMAD